MATSSSASPEAIEEEYVRKVYSRLASYVRKTRAGTSACSSSSPSSHLPASQQRLCPAACRFIASLPPHSLVVDVGCGENKYDSSGGFVVGIDPCAEILVKSRPPAPGGLPAAANSLAGVAASFRCDLALADALQLPLRDGAADAALLVSVLHHLASGARRRAALVELARVMAPGARALIVVFAFEQPHALFEGQDVLVPWNLHEIALNGRLPNVRFHMSSTKVQRIIQASIPISIAGEPGLSTPLSPSAKPSLPAAAVGWLSRLVGRFRVRSFSAAASPPSASPTAAPPSNGTSTTTPPLVPPATPGFLPQKRKMALFSGIHRWSPGFARRIATLLRPIEEEFADELAEEIMVEAVNEALAAIREVTFYRYYHVFRKGELEALAESVAGLRVVTSLFENGNWNVTVEKRRAGDEKASSTAADKTRTTTHVNFTI